jgi:hypothetical protein
MVIHLPGYTPVPVPAPAMTPVMAARPILAATPIPAAKPAPPLTAPQVHPPGRVFRANCNQIARPVPTPVAPPILAPRSAPALAHTQDYECYGCLRRFLEYSSMISHLESGSCRSGWDRDDLDDVAARCNQWKQFMNIDKRSQILNDYSVCNAYFCPGCYKPMGMLSGLLSHVEKQSCGQRLNRTPIQDLKKWLGVKLMSNEGRGLKRDKT